MIKFIHVFDCDGVLLSSLHRYQTAECGTRIDLDHWIENCTPEQIWQDTPLPMAEVYKKYLADPEHYVIIATARVCQQADFDCIEAKIGLPQKFIYREKGDHTGGAKLKLAQLKPLLNLKQFKDAIWTIYEDNLTYLNDMATELNATRVHIFSEQGH